MNEWFAEYEDDVNALPTHNNGFTLTFSKEADGSISLTPGGTGDFNNFFRKATINIAEPKNPCPKAIILGKHSTFEQNQWYENTSMPYQFNTYYKLSSANRSFSSTKESLGEAIVVFNLVDEGLIMNSAITMNQVLVKCGGVLMRLSRLKCSVSHHSSPKKNKTILK